MRTLVLGGSRSGKSAFAEALLSEEPAVDYVATAVRDHTDRAWSDRIAAHQARRPKTWRTIETGDVAMVLVEDGPAMLVDSVTAWLSRTMDECHAWSRPNGERLLERLDELVEAWRLVERRVVLVSDEVGLGVVPETPVGRQFRDELGLLNQRLAVEADEVVLVVAGVPLRLR